MQWVWDVLSPLLVFVGVVGGWVIGWRRQSAEVESLTAQASRLAVESLLSTVKQLESEIAALRGEVHELKTLNRQLLDENEHLAADMTLLRRLVQTNDDYPPYYHGSEARIREEGS